MHQGSSPFGAGVTRPHGTSPWGSSTRADVALTSEHAGLLSLIVPVVGASTNDLQNFDERELVFLIFVLHLPFANQLLIFRFGSFL